MNAFAALLASLVLSACCSGTGAIGGTTGASGGNGPGCDGGVRNTFAGACGPDGGSLDGCLLGVWLGASPAPCSDYSLTLCARDAGEPECAASDCQYDGFSIFEAADVLEGSYLYSASQGTFSSRLPASREAWMLDDGGVALGTAKPVSASCTAAEIVIGGYSVSERASASFAATLAALAADGGTWTAQPYAGP